MNARASFTAAGCRCESCAAVVAAPASNRACRLARHRGGAESAQRTRAAYKVELERDARAFASCLRNAGMSVEQAEDGCAAMSSRAHAANVRAVVLPPAEVPSDGQLTIAMLEAGLARETIAATLHDLRAFANFTAGPVTLPIPQADVAGWLASMLRDGLSAATLRRRAGSLERVHALAGLDRPSCPVIASMLSNAGRRRSTPTRAALTTEMIDLAAQSGQLSARALATVRVGLVAGLGRAELASIAWDHLGRSSAGQWHVSPPNGVTTIIRDVAACQALDALAFPGGRSGLVFGCGATIVRAIKRAATLAGCDAARYSARSLGRAGGSL